MAGANEHETNLSEAVRAGRLARSGRCEGRHRQQHQCQQRRRGAGKGLTAPAYPSQKVWLLLRKAARRGRLVVGGLLAHLSRLYTRAGTHLP